MAVRADRPGRLGDGGGFMTRTRETRTTLARVLGAAVLLAMLPVLAVWWIEGDGAGQHASVGVLSLHDAASNGTQVDEVVRLREPPSTQPLRAPARAAIAPQVDAFGARLEEQGFFSGVPRAWLVPSRIIGRVVDERGAPVVGAIIQLMPDEATLGVVRQAVGSLPPARPSASSGADGRFTLETWHGLPGAGMLPLSSGKGTPAVSITGPTSATLRVRCPGWRSGVSDVGTQVLRAGAVVEGRVVDGEGRPLAGLVGPRGSLAPR